MPSFAITLRSCQSVLPVKYFPFHAFQFTLSAMFLRSSAGCVLFLLGTQFVYAASHSSIKYFREHIRRRHNEVFNHARGWSEILALYKAQSEISRIVAVSFPPKTRILANETICTLPEAITCSCQSTFVHVEISYFVIRISLTFPHFLDVPFSM